MVFCVAVADVLELESTVESNEPSGKTKQKLREWRVDIEVVFS